MLYCVFMFIENEIKLDFKDVLIKPKRSTLSSRKEVDLTRYFKFKYSKREFNGIPLIAANMDTIATPNMCSALRQYNLVTALHKHLSQEEIELCIDTATKDNQPNHVFLSMGLADEDIKKFQQIYKNNPNINVCIDVANGYSTRFDTLVRNMREIYPSVTIMAGNVVTAEMTEQLILSGADIVKIGIGSGCQVADTRILMSNGTYKNIIDVQPGDRIITMTGEPATVKKSFTTGYRKVRNIKNAHFYKPLTQTSDHNCFVGDLSSISERTLQARGYKKLLETSTYFGESKLAWKETKNLNNCVGLVPNKIQWELPQKFEYNISEYFLRAEHKPKYNMVIKSNYNLGYMFGFFLGDGHARKTKGTNSKGFSSFSGGVEWYINSKDQNKTLKLSEAIFSVVGKTPTITLKKSNPSVTTVILYSKQWGELLLSFGKFNEKHLPEKYMCLDKQYLQGIYDGLIDSDGHITSEGQINFNNTSPQLIELFGWLNYELFGSFPNMINCGKQSSYLVETPRNDGYRSFLANTHTKRQLDNYQIIKILNVSEEHEIEVPVFDLEIDHPTHSFIANNMIVHNSVCTTRKQTGVGYPQLSAIIECADAAHGLGGLICADGGCTMPGDVAKAFGAGADFVMLGGMLAGHDECDGEIFNAKITLKHLSGLPSYFSVDWDKYTIYFDDNVPLTITEDVYNTIRKLYYLSTGDERITKLNDPLLLKYPQLFEIDYTNAKMKFYGMSSKTAMDKHNGGVAEYRSSEGKTVSVPYKGPVENTVKDILGGLRSTCTYVGAVKLKELSKRTTFIRVNQTHNTIFGY